ncbi:MAG: type II toxin-antitoxin system Phd/YefM family antitoxin [Boseongicola sp. SB0662_bin_57]|nr:type II toxin-antitoxin system Phd/YefM family antitoxin [Boseongicola sp. SB0662_bin_57]
MEEIQISKFKATCLAVLDRVGRMRKPVLITRFGKPVAQILPPPPSPAGEWLGAMQDDGEIRDDLIAPAADLAEWNVLR